MNWSELGKGAAERGPTGSNAACAGCGGRPQGSWAATPAWPITLLGSGPGAMGTSSATTGLPGRCDQGMTCDGAWCGYQAGLRCLPPPPCSEVAVLPSRAAPQRPQCARGSHQRLPDRSAAPQESPATCLLRGHRRAACLGPCGPLHGRHVCDLGCRARRRLVECKYNTGMQVDDQGRRSQAGNGAHGKTQPC